jgi:ATPase subunit of ABC transporter with duplicated ATPase domains
MLALNSWNGGVIIISHDERFITSVAKEVCDVAAITSVAILM